MRAAICWLASYPKSGNTWLRVFLVNLLRGASEPADINSLADIPSAASRSLFDAYAGVDASDLTMAEVESLRPAVFEQWAAESAGPRFLKIHDAVGRTPSGVPLIPPAITRGAIYIARNPLDIAASYSHHSAEPIDRIIDRMADETYTMEDDDGAIHPQLPQTLRSWSGHVAGWLDQQDFPVLLVRYEEMLAAPREAFGRIAAFAGVPHTDATLERAERFSRFSALQEQEAAAGFRGGSIRAPSFFRRGQAGGWRDELTPAQAERIRVRHGAVMQRLGYLDDGR